MMKKDDLKKMLEDDFFGEGDSLGGLEDISLDDNEQPDFSQDISSNEEVEDKDIFDLDGFDFDEEESLLGNNLDLNELEDELVVDKDSDKEEDIQSDIYLSDIQSDKIIFEDIEQDVEDILNKPVEQIEESVIEEAVIEEYKVKEEYKEEYTEVLVEDADILYNEDNNTFTNYVQNDTINIEDQIQDLEEDKGIEMVKPTLNYNDFSDAMNQEYINVKKLDFPEISDQLTGSKFKVDLFSNIPVTIDVFLGKTTLSLKDVHDLSKGSVIELDKFYGEPLELKINGELIATGEVVAIDNKYGIMIKDIVKS